MTLQIILFAGTLVLILFVFAYYIGIAMDLAYEPKKEEWKVIWTDFFPFSRWVRIYGDRVSKNTREAQEANKAQ